MKQKSAELAVWIGIIIDILQRRNVDAVGRNAQPLQLIDDQILQALNEKFICEHPELNKMTAFRCGVWKVVDNAEIYLLRVEPVDQKTYCAFCSIFKSIGFSYALDKTAVESCLENWAIVTGKLLVDDEFLGVRELSSPQSHYFMRLPAVF